VSESERPLLLDTHYWIWQQAGNLELISPAIRREIERAAVQGTLLLSAMSIWEVGMLESKGRIRLHTTCELWVAEALAMPGLTLVPLTPEIAIESTRMAGTFQAKPFHRIIAATARVMGARLATSNEKLIDYARQRHILVC
jgi:PIN domain nuclease of toxin-antitoxin system